MFKIKISIQDYSSVKSYHIRLERIPLLPQKIVELQFSNLEIAKKESKNVSRLFNDFYIIIDLFYLKIKQFEGFDCPDLTTKSLLSNHLLNIEKQKIFFYDNQERYAHQYHEALLSFLDSILKVLPHSQLIHKRLSNELFALLLDLRQSFLDVFRNYNHYKEIQNLKIFNF